MRSTGCTSWASAAASRRGVLEDGIYYGVRVRGQLVSAAGTHVINAHEGIGVVGNVMTHVDYRGHDFAKMVTSAVTAELLERVADVALNVHTDNCPGRRRLRAARLPGSTACSPSAWPADARAAGESCDPYERHCD